jgi:hypothetical protein
MKKNHAGLLHARVPRFALVYMSPFFSVGTLAGAELLLPSDGAGANAGLDVLVAGTLLSDGGGVLSEDGGGVEEGAPVVDATGLVGGVYGIVYRVDSAPLRDGCPPKVEPLLPIEELPVEGVENVGVDDVLPSDGDVALRLPNDPESKLEVDAAGELVMPLVVEGVYVRFPGNVLPRD